MYRRLVDGFHEAGGGVESEEFGDVPVVVAIAECGGDGEAETVGRPTVFVDVSVGGRDLIELGGGDVDKSEALLEEGVLDFAGFGSFGDEWTSGASGVFGEENGDGFAVGGPAGSGEEAFDLGKFARRAGGGGYVGDIELKLAGSCGVGEKGDFLAVGRPGDAAFGVDGVGYGCGDALGRSFGTDFREVDYGVTGGDSLFCDDVFNPGDFLAVGRDGGLFETVRGGERIDDVLRGAGGFGLGDGFEARFGGLFGAAGLFQRSFLPEDPCAAKRRNSEAAATATRVRR